MKEFINSLWGKKAGKAAIGILAALFIIGGGVTLYERHEAKLAAQTLTLNGNVDLREVSLRSRTVTALLKSWSRKGMRSRKTRSLPVLIRMRSNIR